MLYQLSQAQSLKDKVNIVQSICLSCLSVQTTEQQVGIQFTTWQA